MPKNLTSLFNIGGLINDSYKDRLIPSLQSQNIGNHLLMLSLLGINSCNFSNGDVLLLLNINVKNYLYCLSAKMIANI